MIITAITADRHLYSAADVFTQEHMEYINSTLWETLPYTRLEIGKYLRREIHQSLPFMESIADYARSVLKTQVEETCCIKFDSAEFDSVTWWLDEPGFRPQMHTDGPKPAALQVYLLPDDHEDVGTAFYNSPNQTDLLHVYPFVQNTGYLALATHELDGQTRELWHDMQRAVPANILRLTVMISFGPYRLL
jgi:hypothetical protein